MNEFWLNFLWGWRVVQEQIDQILMAILITIRIQCSWIRMRIQEFEFYIVDISDCCPRRMISLSVEVISNVLSNSLCKAMAK